MTKPVTVQMPDRQPERKRVTRRAIVRKRRRPPVPDGWGRGLVDEWFAMLRRYGQ